MEVSKICGVDGAFQILQNSIRRSFQLRSGRVGGKFASEGYIKVSKGWEGSCDWSDDANVCEICYKQI